MKSVDQKLIKGPVTLATVTSHFLARLLYAAMNTKASSPLLHLNVSQVKKYQLYEFTFGPTAQFDGELKALFETEFKKEEARAVFDELQALLPDGVKLLYTLGKTSTFPRYEFQGRLVLLAIYLAARHYLADCKPRHLSSIAQHLHKLWEKAAQELQSLYDQPLPDMDSATAQFESVKKMVYDFQNQIRAELVTIRSQEKAPELADLKFVAETLSQYEQKLHLNISPELAELERELNCDLFRLDEDGRFQFYQRHLPLTHHQNPKLTRVLLPTITAHADGSSLPNFAAVCEGTYLPVAKQLHIAFCSMRHGTPMSLQKLSADEKDPLQKHKNTYQVFLNYEQELLITRTKAIESILFKYNSDPTNRTKIALAHIQRFSLALSTKITELMHDKLLTPDENLNDTRKNDALLEAAYEQSNQTNIPEDVIYTLLQHSSSIFLVKSFYTHIISGQDHLDEEHQFRACRLAQFALDYAPENPGFIYFCTPLNIPQLADLFDNDIKNTIRSALIEAFFAYNIAFPDDKFLEPKATEPLFRLYRTHRATVATAVKTYLKSCSPDQKLGADPKTELEKLRKAYKTAEDEFHQAMRNPFNTLHAAIIKKAKPSTPAGNILKVIFQIFNNGSLDWSGERSGILPALFHLFSHQINSSEKITVSASGGCKSAHDRWQKLALVLYRMIKTKITPSLLDDLAAVLKEFADDLPFNLSGYQTALGVCTIPKTKFSKLEDGLAKLSGLPKTVTDAKSSPFNKVFYKLYKAFDDLAAHKRHEKAFHKGWPKWNEFILLCTPKNPGFHIWQQFEPSRALISLTNTLYAYCAHDWLKEAAIPESAGPGLPMPMSPTMLTRQQEYRQALLTEIQDYFLQPDQLLVKKTANAADFLAVRWLSEYFIREQFLAPTGGKGTHEYLDPLLLTSQKHLSSSDGKLKQLLEEVVDSKSLGRFTPQKKHTILFKVLDECFRIQISLRRQTASSVRFYGKTPKENFLPEEIKVSAALIQFSLENPDKTVLDVYRALDETAMLAPSSSPNPQLLAILQGDATAEDDDTHPLPIPIPIPPPSPKQSSGLLQRLMGTTSRPIPRPDPDDEAPTLPRDIGNDETEHLPEDDWTAQYHG